MGKRQLDRRKAAETLLHLREKVLRRGKRTIKEERARAIQSRRYSGAALLCLLLVAGKREAVDGRNCIHIVRSMSTTYLYLVIFSQFQSLGN